VLRRSTEVPRGSSQIPRGSGERPRGCSRHPRSSTLAPRRSTRAPDASSKGEPASSRPLEGSVEEQHGDVEEDHGSAEGSLLSIEEGASSAEARGGSGRETLRAQGGAAPLRRRLGRHVAVALSIQRAMGRLDRYAKEIFDTETPVVTRGAAVWLPPSEIGLTEVRLDGRILVRDPALLAESPPPWQSGAR